MKNKSGNKWIFKLVIAIAVFFVVIHFLSAYTDIYPDYSVKNKTKTGYSIFYEALEELALPVSCKSNNEISELDTETIQIVASNGTLDIEEKETMFWVEKGGILVYLSYGSDIVYGDLVKEEDGIGTYQYGDGLILLLDKDAITNWELTKDRDLAYQLYMNIGELDRPIVFNEYHLYSVDVENSLWYAIPLKYKWVIYHLLVVVLAYLYYAGKRFGKTQTFYEEVERDENEYLHAAAYTYQKAKCWDIILNSFYKYFLKKIRCTHDNWIKYWQKEGLPSLNKAEKVHDVMDKPLAKKKAGYYLKVIVTIELLNRIMNKRREQVWKNWTKM